MYELYFFLSLAVNIIFLLVIVVLVKYKNFRTFISQAVATAEQLIPAKSGAEKLEWVLETIRSSSFLARIFSNNFLINLIETALKVMQSYAGENKDV